MGNATAETVSFNQFREDPSIIFSFELIRSICPSVGRINPEDVEEDLQG